MKLKSQGQIGYDETRKSHEATKPRQLLGSNVWKYRGHQNQLNFDPKTR